MSGKILLLLIFTLFSVTVQAADKDSFVIAKAQQLKQRASLIYETKPDTAIALYDQAAELFKLGHNKKEAAVCLQNIAFIYDAYRKDSYKALLHVREAHSVWKETKDTAAIADIYRYIGNLQTKMNDTRTAKSNIDTATSLFRSIHDEAGLATTHYYMATVYDHEKKTDSAVYYLNLSQGIGKKLPGAEARTFDINNMLLRMYVLDDKFKEAKKPYKQNAKHVNNEKISLHDRLTFYYYSWIYFSRRKKEKQANEYKSKYDSLKKEMQDKGMIV